MKAAYQKLDSRIQAMYIDKLDGKILGDFFESMSSKWREEQFVLLSNIQKHQNASQHYLLEGIQLIELARNVYYLFIRKRSEKCTYRTKIKLRKMGACN